MFTVSVLCRLRPRVSPASSRFFHAAAAGHGGPCHGGFNLRPLHAERKAFLGSDTKLLIHRPFVRFLSTETPSDDGTLIYKGSMALAVRGVKTFSYSSSLASLIIMPQILWKSGLAEQGFALQAAFIGVIGIFTFVTPMVLHFFTKGYVLRLYHNADTDTYTAVTYSVFLTEKRTKFHQSQVRLPPISKMFTNFYAGSAGMLINPDLFALPQDYNHLMGYDKPFRFDAEDMDGPEKN